MSKRLEPVGAAALLLAASLAPCVGCVGVAAPGFGLADVGTYRALELAGADEGSASARPAVAMEVPRALPRLFKTIHANGVVWIGYNMATTESGGIGQYDAGSGSALGVAFGNGQDIKHFVEVGYERTVDHTAYDAAGLVISTAAHDRYYIGMRRYLLPLAETSGRIAPFVVGGVTVQTISGTGAVPTPSGNVLNASGAGVYLGTGIEIYIGASSQFALALDLRGSILSYDGSPEGSGTQTTLGGALSLVYHF